MPVGVAANDGVGRGAGNSVTTRRWVERQEGSKDEKTWRRQKLTYSVALAKIGLEHAATSVLVECCFVCCLENVAKFRTVLFRVA